MAVKLDKALRERERGNVGCREDKVCPKNPQVSVIVVHPFPKKPCFLGVCCTNLLKTLWEKEKLLITSNFSFSHSVFYPFSEHSTISIKFKTVVCKFLKFGRVKNLSYGKGLQQTTRYYTGLQNRIHQLSSVAFFVFFSKIL